MQSESEIDFELKKLQEEEALISFKKTNLKVIFISSTVLLVTALTTLILMR
jgi:hypothetical protein